MLVNGNVMTLFLDCHYFKNVIANLLKFVLESVDYFAMEHLPLIHRERHI
jgi:hypothetical protein